MFHESRPAGDGAAARGGGPVLPVELMYDIWLKAAYSDRHTAHTLAFVSRAAEEVTRAARWRTIVIQSAQQLELLWKVLIRYQGTSQLEAEDALSERQRSRPLGHETQALFVETVGDEALLLHFELQTQHQRAAEAEGERLRLEDASWSDVQKARLAKPKVCLNDFLRFFPNIEVLGLGVTELELFLPSIHAVSPREMGLVYDGNDTILFTALLTDPPGSPDEEEQSEVGLVGVRRRLERLHVIGLDPRNGIAGVPMPVALLEPLRRGSTSPGSFLDRLCASPAGQDRKVVLPSSGRESSTGVTHLRYDTRKFSFRPVEIMTRRLKPFLLEVAPTAVAATKSNDCATWTHTGLPHARPPRGAGASGLSQHGTGIGDLSSLEQDTVDAKTLRAWGAGGFERLHLAWDTSGDSVGAVQRSRYSQDKDNGGWPLERKNVWTERSDRELAPTFQAEVAEALRQNFGWSRPSAEFENGVGLDAGADDEFLRRAARMLGAELSASKRIEGNGDGSESGSGVADGEAERERQPTEQYTPPQQQLPTLQFCPRAPAAFVRLGGPSAGTRSQRLAFFEDRVAGGLGCWT